MAQRQHAAAWLAWLRCVAVGSLVVVVVVVVVVVDSPLSTTLLLSLSLL